MGAEEAGHGLSRAVHHETLSITANVPSTEMIIEIGAAGESTRGDVLNEKGIAVESPTSTGAEQAASDVEAAGTQGAGERWNSSPIAAYRYVAVNWAFIIMGMTDACIGVCDLHLCLHIARLFTDTLIGSPPIRKANALRPYGGLGSQLTCLDRGIL